MARITLVEKLYFQPHGENPSLTEGSFGRDLKDEESNDARVYSRILNLNPNSTIQLDSGWFESNKVGQVLIKNKEGDFASLPNIPTQEYKDDILKRVVTILTKDGEPIIKILPNESCRFHPVDITGLRLTCDQGPAKVEINLYPGD